LKSSFSKSEERVYDIVVERIEILRDLITDTQPEVMGYDLNDNYLFQQDQVDVEEMMRQLNERDIYDMSQLMKEANRIFNFRKRVKNGEVDITDIEAGYLDEVLKELIMKGQKINAIKHYRKKMGVVDKNGEVKGPSLKESKEYVDNLQERYKLRSNY
jgi:ribosomal protein L7/L12